MDTITDTQIEQLRNEASWHDDTAMVAICDRALAGDDSSRRACADAISYARGEV